MSVERIILIAVWVLACLALLIYVPKVRYREAIVIFMFKQVMTWLLGIITVEAGLIEYPVRIFTIAVKTSFTFEYFVYPVICIFFVLYYPEAKGLFREFLHYFYYCSVITAVELVLEKYTDLIKYIHWTWYYTWISLVITFFFSRTFYKWFFKEKS